MAPFGLPTPCGCCPLYYVSNYWLVVCSFSRLATEMVRPYLLPPCSNSNQHKHASMCCCTCVTWLSHIPIKFASNHVQLHTWCNCHFICCQHTLLFQPCQCMYLQLLKKQSTSVKTSGSNLTPCILLCSVRSPGKGICSPAGSCNPLGRL